MALGLLRCAPCPADVGCLCATASFRDCAGCQWLRTCHPEVARSVVWAAARAVMQDAEALEKENDEVVGLLAGKAEELRVVCFLRLFQ